MVLRSSSLRLLSHDTVCNRGLTRSGAENFSRLYNPMGVFTHVVYGKSAGMCERSHRVIQSTEVYGTGPCKATVTNRIV